MADYKSKKKAFLEIKDEKCVEADLDLLKTRYALCPRAYIINPHRHADAILFTLLDFVPKEEILQHRADFYRPTVADEDSNNEPNEPKDEPNNEPEKEPETEDNAAKVETAETHEERADKAEKRAKKAEKKAEEAEKRAQEAEERAEEESERADEQEERADDAEQARDEAEERAAAAEEALEQEKKKE